MHEDGSRLLVWELLTPELRLKLRGCLMLERIGSDDVKFGCTTCSRVTRCAVTAVKHVTRFYCVENRDPDDDPHMFRCPTCDVRLACSEAAQHFLDCVRLRCSKCKKRVRLFRDLSLDVEGHATCIAACLKVRKWVRIKTSRSRKLPPWSKDEERKDSDSAMF